jgi:hypothetical protein
MTGANRRLQAIAVALRKAYRLAASSGEFEEDSRPPDSEAEVERLSEEAMAALGGLSEAAQRALVASYRPSARVRIICRKVTPPADTRDSGHRAAPTGTG